MDFYEKNTSIFHLLLADGGAFSSAFPGPVRVYSMRGIDKYNFFKINFILYFTCLAYERNFSFFFSGGKKRVGLQGNETDFSVSLSRSACVSLSFSLRKYWFIRAQRERLE